MATITARDMATVTARDIYPPVTAIILRRIDALDQRLKTLEQAQRTDAVNAATRFGQIDDAITAKIRELNDTVDEVYGALFRQMMGRHDARKTSIAKNRESVKRTDKRVERLERLLDPQKIAGGGRRRGRGRIGTDELVPETSLPMSSLGGR